MQNRTLFKNSLLAAGALALGLSASTAFAQHGGGGHFGGGGGGHAMAGGGHVAGYGGGYRGGYAGGYHGGYRGGYYGGYRGGYGYYRGGYGYGGWGWGLGGLGLGLYFASLPLYYSTYWWDGIPYYYADNTYYRYDSSAQQYQTVAPPEGLADQNASQLPAGTELIAYPKNGQSTEQQSKDKYECHHWATTQTGFDPTQGAPPAGSDSKRTDYMRAQAACLDGRGYSVK